jgi:hypothetical protein
VLAAAIVLVSLRMESVTRTAFSTAGVARQRYQRAGLPKMRMI